MKELQDILCACESIIQSGSPAALVTVLKVRGSTYRRAGARMLVKTDGTTIGSISGGCLESDVVEKARGVMKSGKTVTASYDLTSDDENVWGLNQGCNGVVDLLIESIDPKKGSSYLRFLRSCVEGQEHGAVATVFRVDGELKVSVGTRLMVDVEGTVAEDIRNPVLTSAALEDCQKILHTTGTSTKLYQFTEGLAEVFLEAIQPPTPLIIFGAGYDALPLTKFAKELGWNVTIVDHRPAFITRERFPLADAVVLARPEETGNKILFPHNAVAVIMTHNFSHDLELLKQLLPSPLKYLGILGPKKRTELLLQTLQKNGFEPKDDQLRRLHFPIGMNIGAESPEEIALSVLSEIQAVNTDRPGGFLKDFPGPIHNPKK